jgi:catechol 2,3-dioxygenase-like lactoylglutathione lyase family enzyme
MIGYVTLGTNDLPKAAAFYDTLLSEIGAKRLWETPRGICWGTAEDQPTLAVMKPFDEQPATPGNGVMVGLAVGTVEAVNRIHHKALSLGCKDEGAVGPRGGGWYCGYFRDLEGNKLLAFCIEA